LDLTNAAKVAVWLAVGLPAACAMEPWAALLHGRAWHGPLWPVHRSHHAPRRGRFERNDALSATHAPVAMALVLYGCLGAPGLAREAAFGAGLGMTLFGLAYVLVHDGLVHGRLPVSWLLRFRYLRRVRGAHLVHHRTGGAPFGLFLGPWTLRRRHRAARERATRPPQRAVAATPSRASASR
jgi:beta-carotene 3-hydroxylase